MNRDTLLILNPESGSGATGRRRRDIESRLRASLGHDNIDVEGAKVLSGVRPQYLDAALDEMERACGSQDAYLEQAIGLKTAHREELREHFLE